MATLTQADFERVPGPARAYRNKKTGKVISRRQYQNLSGVSFEAKAKANREKDAAAQLARPAKGRSSVRKLSKEMQADIVKARQEAKESKAAAERARKEETKRLRKVEQMKKKKIHRKKIRPQLLRSGNMGERIAFETYEDYLEAIDEAKRSGVVFAYGLGWSGVDSRDLRELDVTVLRLTALSSVLGEEEFDEIMEESQLEKPYMDFLHYWMHVAFKREYADKRKAKRRANASRKGKR